MVHHVSRSMAAWLVLLATAVGILGLPGAMRRVRPLVERLPADPSLAVPMSQRVGRLLAVVFCAAVVAGSAMRVVHLDRQIFWDDEVWTAVRVAGTRDSALYGLFDGRTLRAAQVDALLRARATSLQPVINGLAGFEPQWPPLYFALEWVWSGLFGTSPVALRALAALFGIASLPVVYWLACELFRARAPAALATALVALSPAEIVYAREARGYSLLLLITAASMSSVLYALRTRRRVGWYAFAALSIAGLYDYMMYVPILGGELLYVMIAQGFRVTGAVRNAGIACAAAVGAFAPWIVVIVHGRWTIAGTMTPTAASFSPLFYGAKAVLDVAMTFFATTYFNLNAAPVAVVVALLVLLAAFSTLRYAPRAGVALACLSLPTVLTTVAWDIALHEHVLLIYRYETPLWLALQLAVAGGFSARIVRSRGIGRTLWQTSAAALLLACTTSSALAIGQPTFWDSWYDADAPAVARIVNAQPHPLLVTDAADEIFTYVRLLRPDVRIRFSRPQNFALPAADRRTSNDALLLTSTSNVPLGWRRAALERLYTFDGSTSLVIRLRQRYHLRALAYGTEPFIGRETLWRLRGARHSGSATRLGITP